MAKEFSVAFYNSKAWKRCRKAYIDSVNGLCERCLDKGVIKNGYIVHHKKKLTPNNINDVNITLGWENLEYLCQQCHNEDEFSEHSNKPKIVRNYMFDINGDVIPL